MKLFTAATIVFATNVNVGATDLKIKVFQTQRQQDDNNNSVVPLTLHEDDEFRFFCGRAGDLDKDLSDIKLFDTKIDEEGYPLCLDVEDEVVVVAYHPLHGYGKQKVDMNSIRGGRKDVVVTLDRHLVEQDLLARHHRHLQSGYDIVRVAELPYRIDSSIDSTETITLVESINSKSSKATPSESSGIPKGCVVADVDIKVSVEHSFNVRGARHEVTLSKNGTSELLDTNEDSGIDFYDADGISPVPFDLPVSIAPGLANFEGLQAAGDWTLDLGDYLPSECGGIISWALFINCAKSSKSSKTSKSTNGGMPFYGFGDVSSMSMQFEEEDFLSFEDISCMSMNIEDANTKEPMERMHPAVKAKVAHCFGVKADEVTVDSYMNMDAATRDCVFTAMTMDQEDVGTATELTDQPTKSPSMAPSKSPSMTPSKSPSKEPSVSPSTNPTAAPTESSMNDEPTQDPRCGGFTLTAFLLSLQGLC